MGAIVPELDQRVITGLLATHLPRAKGRQLMLVHGRYAETAAKVFTVPDGEGDRRSVHVAHATSVLGITDAWQEHRAQHGSDLLVVTTDVADERVGVDLLGEMMRSRTITVDEADIVKQLFGAADLDPRMRRDPWLWLPAALIAAEPREGWPQRGTVLTLDAAMRALVGVRLGLEGVFEGGASVDVDALLAWSQQPGGPDRFAVLPEAEQQGIADWLEQRAGEAAPLLLRLAVSGLGPRATALGLLSSVLSESGDPSSADAALALGSLLNGVRFRPSELRAFTSAVEGTLTRWIGEAAGRGTQSEQARHRVLDVVRQADQLAESVHLTGVLADNPFLPSGFQERLRRLAEALSESADAAQAAWEFVREHQLAPSFYPERVELARMAVRLRRWLDQDVPGVSSVGQAVQAHVTNWGWADRALTQLWQGDTVADPVVDEAYGKLHDAARQRRHLLDEAFASCLARWTQDARPNRPGGDLLIENVLNEVARPLADAAHPPLVVVLTGMTGAVAAELGEELTSTGRWIELGEGGLRRAAVALMPSVTAVCRASLLSGRPVLGGPEEEKENFIAFWQEHDHTASLFHKSDIPAEVGHRLRDQLISAIAMDEVVGVVLDTIDESLDHGRQSPGGPWTVDSVTYLPELLNTARAQGRPVVLVSAHGHVQDRDSSSATPALAEDVEAARWRTGPAGDGEVALDGPRVLENGGRITAAWSEDIHYTPGKAGYRGGAALAEMAVPVLVLAPTDEVAPEGWATVPRESVEPSWWERSAEPVSPFVPAVEPKLTKKLARKTGLRPKTVATSDAPVDDETAKAPTAQNPPMEKAPEPEQSLGWRVVSTKIYDHQKAFVRRAPDRKVVAAVVDALDAAGGTLSLAAVVAAVTASGGRAPSRPEGIVTVLTRLLNVEGYDVINLIDTRTRVRLNRDQLIQQFELTQAEGGVA
ncbi:MULTISPECIES: BREX-2 system phosphatase PglZ [Streptomyces]|uniref:BREX-2 system phosphatase PglZ n=1 Tax=Streptomyces dengpaensis TaxID=2049881 RepID=A0ABM6SWR3_9ACTN|nr:MULTISPECIES: BREX-2 system phosphatase PglZ [Streptomyces]AVH59040.1 BREX-2 system phosphatase PglZ [Streptomyces dengpaensis]PIB05966.1 hypothetical protein B1C81_27030 [Streptomyces sp. HG99]